MKDTFVIVNEKKVKVENKTLDLSDRIIEDIYEIEGLENLTDLKELDLHNNEITEIKGLEKLIKLEILDISVDPIGRELNNN